MIATFTQPKFILRITWLLAGIGSICILRTVFGSQEAESRNYLQFIPATPFVGAEDTNHKYMRVKEPVSPWRVVGSQPTWEEVMLYKQKLESLRAENNKSEAPAIPAATPGGPATLPNVDVKLPAPTLTLENQIQSHDSTPTEITVSPWFNIQTPQAMPQGIPISSPNPEQPTPPGEKSSQPPPSMPWLREPAPGGGDIYIPYSSLPGVNAPPSNSTTAPSAVIYSQPKPAGSP
jgi:hypothetical protein